LPFLNGKVCPPATSEAAARWPRRGGGRLKIMGLWGPFHLKMPLYLSRICLEIARQFRSCQLSSIDMCVVHLQDKVTPSTKALWPGASFQNRSYWYRSSLFWIREDTSAVELMTNRWTGQVSFQNRTYWKLKLPIPISKKGTRCQKMELEAKLWVANPGIKHEGLFSSAHDVLLLVLCFDTSQSFGLYHLLKNFNLPILFAFSNLVAFCRLMLRFRPLFSTLTVAQLSE
jgi:hypothetical protein